MSQPHDTLTPYFAKDGMVWKHPLHRHNDNGTTTISIGFPICKMHEAVGDEAAEQVAELMNLGHKSSLTPPER